MKRLLVLVAVLVPLSFFVAGCGGTGGSSGEKGKQVSKEEMTTKSAELKQKMAEMKKGMGTPGAPSK
jgi:hypothetical protein